ncbi:MAG: HD domain-containing protein [Phycisphaerales bacterium]|nr:HD domain-containing protein [Phycisphaerales bacterium]
MLLRALAVQGLILGVVGGLLLRDNRAAELQEMVRYLEQHNDFTPRLIREQIPDLSAQMFAQDEPRLRQLLSQSRLDPGAAAWIVGEHHEVVWVLADGDPHDPHLQRQNLPPGWATQGDLAAEVESRPGVADAKGLIATRHRLPNGFQLIVVEPAPGNSMFAEASLMRAYARTIAAGIATLGLTAIVGLLIMRRYETQIERINAELEQEVRRQVAAGTERLHAMIFGLAKLADFRDSDTGAHLDRICEYAAALAHDLASERPEIDRAWIENLKLAASLHDIGKVGVPDRVLLKPDGLTQEERQTIERHPLIGADTLIAVRRRMGDSPLLNLCIEIALGHHERWDGTGYPFGLAGEQIALSARIVAVADVYDALRSVRVYKPALSHEQAVETIRHGSGTQFDPEVVGAFLRVEGEFAAIAERWTSPPMCAEGVGLREAA